MKTKMMIWKLIYFVSVFTLVCFTAFMVYQFSDAYGKEKDKVIQSPSFQSLPRHSSIRKTFSQYEYLSHLELTRFGQYIWFWVPDTLTGPVHSNDILGINGGYFHHLVSSSAGNFVGRYFTATFLRGYRLRAPQIVFPSRAWSLRFSANTRGTWLDSQNGTYRFVIVLNNFSAAVYRWDINDTSSTTEGTPFTTVTWSNEHPYAIFCNGELWLKGVVSGKLGIGASGNIKLLDDVKYTDAQNFPYIPPLGSQNYLTIISEAPCSGGPQDPLRGILIAKTTANGAHGGRAMPSDSSHLRDIVITAQLVALRGSFSFEGHNDFWEPQAPIPNPYGLNNDERGDIYLRGALAVYRRDYVHRSNLGGTGYAKRYLYDQRFFRNSPPFVPVIPDRDVGWELE